MLLTSILVLVPMALPQAPDTLDVARITGERVDAVSGTAPLQRMSSEMMRKAGVVTLQEALRGFGGVSVRDYGGIGGLKTVNVRNFGAQHTAVVYDGGLITDAQNGQVDIGRFQMDEASSVKMEISGTDDIFRNARLSSYVGVLSIASSLSLPDSVNTTASALLRAGSFGTWSPAVSVRQRIAGRWILGAWGRHLSSRGDYPFVLRNGDIVTDELRLNSDVSATSAELNLRGDLGQAGDLSLKTSFYDSERGLPGSVVLYTQNPTERLWDRDMRAHAIYSTALGSSLRLKADAGYSRAYNRYVDTSPLYAEPADDRYLQQEFDASAVLLWHPMQPLSFSLAQDLVVNTLDASISNCLFPVREQSYTALSAKYDGRRFEAVATLLGMAMREQVRTGEPAPARQRLSPSLSMSYRLLRDEDLRLRASYKESYRLPTFNDMYYPRIGNKTLEPERASQLNLGLTWARQMDGMRCAITADAYRNMVRDKIVAVPTMFIWSMRNVGLVSMLGTDLTASFACKAASWLDVDATAGYSYQHAVDITDSEAKNYGHQIPYAPRHTANASLVLSTPWLNLGYSLLAVGERYSLAQNTDAYRIAPYADHTLSLNGSWTLARRCVLHLSLEALNLTDHNYEIIRYYPMAGRNYRITIKITY